MASTPNTILHASRHHMSDEALVVGICWVDRHLCGGYLHSPLFDFLQHYEVGIVVMMTGETDMPDLAFFLSLKKCVKYTALDTLVYPSRAFEQPLSVKARIH